MGGVVSAIGSIASAAAPIVSAFNPVAGAVMGGIGAGSTVLSAISGGAGGGGGATPAAVGQQAQQTYDPFAQYRPQYASQLNQFMQSPNVKALPGYQQDLSQGTQAIQRQYAAQGGTASGAQLMALQNYAMNLSNQYYQQNISNLGSLSGATSPQVQVAGAQAGVGAANQASQAQAANVGGGISALSSILAKAGMGGGGPGGTQTAQTTSIDPTIQMLSNAAQQQGNTYW